LQFVRLNILSILYALFLFVPVEFMLNVSAISGLSSEQARLVNTMIVITFLVVVLGAGLTLFFSTRRWFGKQKMRLWTALLWLPYFVLFVVVFTQAFPAVAGEMPTNPVIIWVLAGTLVLYPFYILLINYFSARESS
jgi:glucose-6-phosphate-specific signal transduction histidine kinase